METFKMTWIQHQKSQRTESNEVNVLNKYDVIGNNLNIL